MNVITAEMARAVAKRANSADITLEMVFDKIIKSAKHGSYVETVLIPKEHTSHVIQVLRNGGFKVHILERVYHDSIMISWDTKA